MKPCCAVVSDIGEMEALRGAWESLLERSDSNEPTLSPLWILSWLRVFGGAGGRRLAALRIERGGRLVGLLPLVSRRVFHRCVPLRRLEAAPSGEDEADEIVSEYIGLVAERGEEDVVAEAAARALAEGALGAFDELVLPAMDGTKRAPSALAEALSRWGFSVTLEEQGRCPYVPLPGSFEAYLGALSASKRALVRRSVRDLECFSGGDLVLRTARTPEELEAARRALVTLHAARWQRDARAGVFASPSFCAFHDAVMPELFRRGALELSVLLSRGEPVAALYNVVWKDKVYFYQSGRRADLPAKLRPGIVAHALAIRMAIEAGRREYDFLGGDTRYKMDLALATRPLVRLRAARRSVREALVSGVERAARGLDRLRARPAESGERGERMREREGAVGAVLCGDLNMVRCFSGAAPREAGLPISRIPFVVVSTRADDPTLGSRHVARRAGLPDPASNPDRTRDALLALVEQIGGRPALFYGTDAMLLCVSRNREALSRVYRFSMPPATRVEELVDKARFSELARHLELPVPETCTSLEASTREEFCARVALPCVVKPFNHTAFRRSSILVEEGGLPRKALFARTPDELDKRIAQMRRLGGAFVVQRYVPGGDDHLVSFHAWIDAAGEPVAHHVGRKIRTCPSGSGESTFVEVIRDPEVTRLGLEVVRALGIVGVVKLDFKRDVGTGALWLLEANPRFNLWNRLGAASGVNLPLVAYAELAGLSRPFTRLSREGLRWVSVEADLRAYVRDYGPSGALSLEAFVSSYRGPKIYDVFAWDDPVPLLLTLKERAGAMLARRWGRGGFS